MSELLQIANLGLAGVFLVLLLRGDIVTKGTHEREIKRGDLATEATATTTSTIKVLAEAVSKLAEEVRSLKEKLSEQAQEIRRLNDELLRGARK